MQQAVGKFFGSGGIDVARQFQQWENAALKSLPDHGRRLAKARKEATIAVQCQKAGAHIDARQPVNAHRHGAFARRQLHVPNLLQQDLAAWQNRHALIVISHQGPRIHIFRPRASVIDGIKRRRRKVHPARIRLAQPAGNAVSNREGLLHLRAHKGCSFDQPADGYTRLIHGQLFLVLGPAPIAVDIIVDLRIPASFLNLQMTNRFSILDDRVFKTCRLRKSGRQHRQEEGCGQCRKKSEDHSAVSCRGRGAARTAASIKEYS